MFPFSNRMRAVALWIIAFNAMIAQSFVWVDLLGRGWGFVVTFIVVGWIWSAVSPPAAKLWADTPGHRAARRAKREQDLADEYDQFYGVHDE